MNERWIRTSETDPIRVNWLPDGALELPGRLGMTFAPGKKAPGMEGDWERDLDADLRVLRGEYKTDVLVSLLEEKEYREFGIPELFEKDRVGEIDVLRFAIRDLEVPEEAKAEEYRGLIAEVIAHLREGKNVVVHCRGGLGRTGTVASCVLVELGDHSADEAIKAVRRARKHAVDYGEQEDFVRRFGEGVREREDRRSGAILGLAAGDALGAPYEFLTPDDVPEGPLEMVGGGLYGWAPGETTDDTDLTRAVLEGYQDGPFDLRRVRDAMVRWLETDPKDVGNQTRQALDYLRRHPEALSVPEKPSAQGNGTVMRAAAHGVKAKTPEQAAENAWVEARLTHPSWEARASSALVAVIVERLISGASPQDALEAAYSVVEGRDEADKSVREVFPASDVSEEYVRSSGRKGWTVYTTRLALNRLVEASDFRAGVEGVIRLGGDTDTNAAVAGALLGARFGASNIPPEWLRGLKGRGDGVDPHEIPAPIGIQDSPRTRNSR